MAMNDRYHSDFGRQDRFHDFDHRDRGRYQDHSIDRLVLEDKNVFNVTFCHLSCVFDLHFVWLSGRGLSFSYTAVRRSVLVKLFHTFVGY